MNNIIKKYLRKLVFLFTYYLYIKPNLKKVSYIRIENFRFIVYPTVLSPGYSVSSKVLALFIQNMDNLSGKKVLDMGCGTGIAGIFAASKGANCTAVDINPMAVKAASENADKNGFKDKIKIIESNLFENPHFNDSKFDIIFFNPPYYPGKPKNNFEAAFKGGENYDVIHRFLRESLNYLKKDGVIYIIVSSDMGISTFEEIVNLYDMKHEIAAKIEKFFETFYIVKFVN